MKLEALHLRKTYGATVALNDLSLSVDQVSVLVLIGPSGGGKSTLLRVLSGLEVPDEGTVSINREVLGRTPAAQQAFLRRNGFLFQQFNLFPHLTTHRNVTLPLEIVRGLSPQEAKARADEVLERLGLGPHAHKMPAELSGGQQQRAGIARAIATRPEVLFLDEPTSALDPEMTAEVLEVIQELAEAGQDIILSTHEMGFARAVAGQVAFVAGGRIEETAPPHRLFESPQTAACQRFLSKVMRY